MRTTDEEIEIEVNRIRDAGQYGDLHIVPVVTKRCFIPCGVGECNCFPTVNDRWCIVIDDKLKSAQIEFLGEIKFLEDKINKV